MSWSSNKKSAGRRDAEKRRTPRGPRRGKKLPATITQEHDWEADGSASRVSRLFAVILIVHVAAVGALVFHALTRNTETPPSPLARIKQDETNPGLASYEVKSAAVVERPATESAYLATYRVVSGDSLRGIAGKLKVSEEGLMRINGLHVGTSLFPGQKLYVPSAQPRVNAEQVAGVLGSPAATPPASGGAGSGHAREQGAPPSAPTVVRSSGLSTPSITPPSTPSARGVTNYEIAEGDTIYGLSRRFGVDADQLLRMNGIADPTKVRIGEVIKVPKQ